MKPINQAASRGDAVGAGSTAAEPRARRQPRYVEVADDLRAAIARGDVEQGAALPTEGALCARYGVSRFTVREALRRLQGEGLIRRRRGSGTIVDTGTRVLRQPLSDVAELLQYAHGSEFVFERHGRVTLAAAQAAELGVEPGSCWVQLSGTRSLTPGGVVVALTDVFIAAELAPHVAGLRPGRQTLFEQLSVAAGFRIARVEQDISAVAAGAREAAALGIARRSAVLRIIRTYRDEGGRIVEISVSAHAGDRFTYSMHIDPG